MEPAPACSRLGCDESAVAVFAFDARASLVWLDPISAGRGAGVLCQRHADRMSPPRGWNLLDRRAPEFHLWVGRTATSATPSVRAPRRERPARSRRCAAPGPLLPFDATPEAVAVATGPETPRTWSPHDRPGPEFEQVLDARTPMLARAFDAARPAGGA